MNNRWAGVGLRYQSSNNGSPSGNASDKLFATVDTVPPPPPHYECVTDSAALERWIGNQIKTTEYLSH